MRKSRDRSSGEGNTSQVIIKEQLFNGLNQLLLRANFVKHIWEDGYFSIRRWMVRNPNAACIVLARPCGVFMFPSTSGNNPFLTKRYFNTDPTGSRTWYLRHGDTMHARKPIDLGRGELYLFLPSSSRG